MTSEEIVTLGKSLVRINPGYSSGFFVAPGLIATARHCLDKVSSRQQIHLQSGEVIEGLRVYANEKADLALIRVLEHQIKPLDFDKVEAEPSDIFVTLTLAGMGHSGHAIEYNEGISSGYAPAQHIWEYQQQCYELHHEGHGLAGAPIINTRTHKVRSILVGGVGAKTILGITHWHIIHHVEPMR